MSCRTTQIVVQFREPPHLVFRRRAADGPRESNRLVIQVQPAEGIQLHFETKVPDAGMKLRQTDLEFSYQEKFRGADPGSVRAAAARRDGRRRQPVRPGRRSRGGLEDLRSDSAGMVSGATSRRSTLRSRPVGPARMHRVDGRPGPPMVRHLPGAALLDQPSMTLPSEASTSDSPPLPQPRSMSVQPGGGFCYQVELAWGRWRRWYLKNFRPGYVRRMAALREGDAAGAPHEILDPRDLKYCCNQCTARWRTGGRSVRLARAAAVCPLGSGRIADHGLAAGGRYRAAVVARRRRGRGLAIVPAALLGLVLYFFRDPPRRVPDAAERHRLAGRRHDRRCHAARARRVLRRPGRADRHLPVDLQRAHQSRALEPAGSSSSHYRPGEFLNALRPESAERNECLWIGLEEPAAPHRRFAVRQISGLLATANRLYLRRRA